MPNVLQSVLKDTKMTEFTEIPVIDVGPLVRGENHETLVDEFRHAYSTIGFGYIIGHGIDPALIDAVFEASARFHALPLSEKIRIKLNHLHRGYIPINTSTDVNSKLADVKKPNQSASFMMMREDAVADPDVYLSGPNLWPTLPEFREALLTYSDAMTLLGSRLIKLALAAAGANPEDATAGFQTPTTWLRLLHYPPTPPKAPDDLYGSAPHTDFGCLTLLAQDNVGGLQVKTPTGNWIDAPKIDGAFVVNVGDMLHRMSNGRLLSTPHRVINRSGRERYSCPFFFDPHVSYDVVPLPGTGTPEFDPINFGTFVRRELQAGYDTHKKTR